MSESSQQLLRFVEQVERIEAEEAELRADKRDVFAEAKAQGFDTKSIRALIKRRKMDPADRIEADAILETYEAAIGMADFEGELRVVSEDALDQAVRMLGEQIEGLQDGPLATALRAGVTLILEEREAIRDIQARVSAHKKNMKAQGLEPLRAMDVVRWVEKCEKHGRETMLNVDATYRLYRSTVEVGDAATVDSARDAELLAKFAGVVAKPARSAKAGMASSLLDARRFSGGA